LFFYRIYEAPVVPVQRLFVSNVAQLFKYAV